jgi:hypothetical protein
MYNGLDIQQSRYFIKISVQTWLTKMLAPYFADWLEIPTTPFPTPLGSSESFLKRLYSTVGDPSPKIQAALEKLMGLKYRKAIGELIWPMTTCRPDLSQSVVKCAQASACPAEVHYCAVKNIFRYVATTVSEGIYFWRTEANMDLPDDPLPTISSTPHDIALTDRPLDHPTRTHGYMDSSWGDCLLTSRSFGGTLMRLAGGPIAYKAKLQPTVAISSTEAEFIQASDSGRISLYVRSILWDMGVPQDAATILYEDNDGATAMANAGKPTPRSRHIDIKYYALQEWRLNATSSSCNVLIVQSTCQTILPNHLGGSFSIAIVIGTWDTCRLHILQSITTLFGSIPFPQHSLSRSYRQIPVQLLLQLHTQQLPGILFCILCI